MRAGVVLGAFTFAFRLLLSAGTQASVWWDSARYWNPSGRAEQDVSLLVPLVLRLAHNTVSVTLLQATVGGLCWGALVAVLVMEQRRPLTRALVGVTVAALALSRPVASWDATVLSESLTLSFTALWVATLVLTVRRPSRSLAPLLAASAVLVGAHPLDALFAVPVVVAVIARRNGMSRRARGVLCTVAVLPALWAAASTASFQDSSSCAPNLTCRAFYALTRLGDLGADPRYTELAEAAGMPHCASLDDSLARFRATRHVFTLGLCAEAVTWLDTGGVGQASLWAHQPVLALQLAVPRLEAMLSPPAYGGPIGIPAAAEGVALLALVAVLWHRRVDPLGVLLVACCVAASLAVVLADGNEHARHVLPFTVPIVLTLVWSASTSLRRFEPAAERQPVPARAAA